MSANSFELASTTAKEIILKLIDPTNLPMLNPNILTGVALASHLGDCYQALYKKAFEVIK